MILPFSSSRSSTSLTSNCLYCASLTPRAMFSKSMNIASFRSPSIDLYYRGEHAHGPHPVRALEAATHEEARPVRGGSCPARPGVDREMAGSHVRPHPWIRPEALDVPLLRARGARSLLELG